VLKAKFWRSVEKRGVALVLSVKGKSLEDLYLFFCKAVSAHTSPKNRHEFVKQCWKGSKAHAVL